MANLTLREDLIAKLEELAQRQHRSVDELVESMIADRLPAPTSTADEREAILRQDRLRLYEMARRYWRSVGNVERAAMTDEQLDEQFWLFDHDGIPRLKSEQGTIELPYDPLDAMLQSVEANPSQWSFGATDISERSREILRNEFADHLIARMNRPIEPDNG